MSQRNDSLKIINNFIYFLGVWGGSYILFTKISEDSIKMMDESLILRRGWKSWKQSSYEKYPWMKLPSKYIIHSIWKPLCCKCCIYTCSLGKSRIVMHVDNHQWQLICMYWGYTEPKKSKEKPKTWIPASRLVDIGLEGEIQRNNMQNCKWLFWDPFFKNL